MSDDKSSKTPDTASNPSTSTSTSTTQPASQPRQQEDFIASVRRFADEHISAALHSVFGIPSILQTPSSSNWIREEADRSRFEDINRRDSAGDGSKSNNNGRDNENGNGSSGGSGSSGSAASGFGGDSGGSSGQNPSSPSPSGPNSNRDSNQNNDVLFTIKLPRLPMPPEILPPEPLLNIGLQATNLLDRNISGHVEQIDKLINEEMDRQKEISAEKLRNDLGPFQQEFQRLLDIEAKIRDKKMKEQKDVVETVIIRGTQVNDEEPKYTVTKYTGSERPSILKELFGEDMYGSQRRHPLFTSFFDEFLPDGRYNQRDQSPPTPVGGWKAHTHQPSAFPIFSLNGDPFGHVFQLMMAPWIQKIHESSDINQLDARGRVISRVKNEIWNDKRDDDPSFEEFQKMMHEERTKIAKERIQRLTEKRQELEKLLKDSGGTGRLDAAADELTTLLGPDRVQKQVESREARTELDLHDFFASLGEDDKKEENPQSQGKKLVSQSISTTSTIGRDGVTRVKKVRERRFSDGTKEREVNVEETPFSDPYFRHLRPLEEPRHKSNRGEDHPVIRALEEHKKQTEGDPKDTKSPSASVSEEKRDGEDDGKKGGWGSWLWAPPKKD